MWLCTIYGFYSVVVGRPDLSDDADGGDKVMVRARVRQHLTNLQETFTELRSAPIIKTEDADYLYRLVIPKQVWAAVIAKLTAGINYHDFKGEVAVSGLTEQTYEKALHDVWERMYRLQALER